MPAFIASRRVWWGILALVALLACLGVLLPSVISAVPQAPAVTSVSLPVVRFVRDVAAAVTVGCVAVGGLVAPGRSTRALAWSTVWGLVWLAALTAQLVLTLSDILAVSATNVLDLTVMWSFLTTISVGEVFLWQGIAVVLVLLLGRVVMSRPTAWLVVLIALAGASAPAFLGHGGLAGGHAAATISLACHLAAISLWLGGLAVVVALVRSEPSQAVAVLPRFSALALGCVIVVAESGLLNASLRLTTPSLLLGSDYGSLLLVKSALLLGLVLLAWQQRSRVLPALAEATDVTIGALARVASGEFLAMGAAVAVGVAMARVGPDVAGPALYVVNPMSVAVLGAALPMALAIAVQPRDERGWVRWARRYPEMAAVIQAVVIVEVAGVGLPTALFGADLGAIAGGLLLLAAGWLVAVALQGDRGASGRISAIAAWTVASVVVFWFESAGSSTVPSLWWSVLALIVATGCLVFVRRPLVVSQTAVVEVSHG